MNEFLNVLIKRSGAMWAQTADRTTSPVLITLSMDEGGHVWELTLPPNEPHPFWRVEDRCLTAEEAKGINAMQREHSFAQIGVIWPVSYDSPTGNTGESYITTAFISNGRKPEWSICIDKVRVTVERLPR